MKLRTQLEEQKNLYKKRDEEYRVWYVGITRTIKNLYLIRCSNKSKEFKI